MILIVVYHAMYGYLLLGGGDYYDQLLDTVGGLRFEFMVFANMLKMITVVRFFALNFTAELDDPPCNTEM